jgi:6-pyruvoyltetrahydropterin/6-carboxytetrahydropterin synthase
MRLRAEFPFAAAHRLPYYDGPCFRMHGHNYRLLVQVEGQPDPKSGMILDFVKLQAIVQAAVLERCDHHTLNDLMDNPTAENLVRWMWIELKPQLHGLCQLELFETDEFSVIYQGE